jgi:hypothetical protein
MQTFLPYPNFVASVICLDDKRLGKQRVEARQIQTALQNGGGWANHPATKMWEGHIEALMLYGDCCIREWIRRGHNNTMPMMLAIDERVSSIQPHTLKIKIPSWIGRQDFHASHRSNLLRKDPDWYSQFGWTESPDMEYVWPSKEKEK